MNLLVVVVLSAVILLTAYRIYGSILTRLLGLRADVPTPAVTLRDDVDYAPIDSKFLLGQHFSAIAAAGPIVGPILAGYLFGWLPALLWILVGSIFIGGVHDMTALTASIRHKARSIAEVVRDNMSRRSYLLFLAFVWLALVYIIVAFTDVTSSSFLGLQTLENNEIITGGGIATSSLLYLAIPLLMGLCLRYTKLSIGWATAIFLPLVGLSIWVGQFFPLAAEDLFGMPQFVAEELPPVRNEALAILNPGQREQFEARASHPRRLFELGDKGMASQLELTEAQVASLKTVLDAPSRKYNLIVADGQRLWNVALLVYCILASVAPMWLLLQPRGHLGGYFLYIALAAGALGVVLGGKTVEYPAFRGFAVTDASGTVMPLFPLLFITIACGACSGFHSIIASGTTSKQLRCEPDARLIGYGSMLLEAMVAIVSLCCVMMLRPDSDLLAGGQPKPNFLYSRGIGSFLSVVGVPATLGVSFGLMAFTTFVYDTLDVCTRLGRYILQELTGWTGRTGKFVATALTAGFPLLFLIWQPVDESGRIKERWRLFWDLFGASNQLLAALTLLGVTVWLWKTRRAMWVLYVTGIPCVFMYVMSMWALARAITPLGQAVRGRLAGDAGVNLWSNPVPWVALVLACLGVLMALEAVRIVLAGLRRPPATKGAPVLGTTG
ncbi:MAG: carbon starvation protein A [Planctomycetaceae bacterium]